MPEHQFKTHKIQKGIVPEELARDIKVFPFRGMKNLKEPVLKPYVQKRFQDICIDVIVTNMYRHFYYFHQNHEACIDFGENCFAIPSVLFETYNQKKAGRLKQVYGIETEKAIILEMDSREHLRHLNYFHLVKGCLEYHFHRLPQELKNKLLPALFTASMEKYEKFTLQIRSQASHDLSELYAFLPTFDEDPMKKIRRYFPSVMAVLKDAGYKTRGLPSKSDLTEIAQRCIKRYINSPGGLIRHLCALVEDMGIRIATTENILGDSL